jgi:hypothetical protein
VADLAKGIVWRLKHILADPKSVKWELGTILKTELNNFKERYGATFD